MPGAAPDPSQNRAAGAPAGAAPGPGAAALLLLGLFAAAALGYWLAQGWPRQVAEPDPAPDGDRVACLSYAPFRLPGETPFDPAARVSRARIEADLRILATRTACVRTYSVDQGLDQVPAVARELGMTVLLGAWLGRDRERNRDELARAVTVARAERSAVRALVVGNEVLLRRELPEHELRATIEEARRALRKAAPRGSPIPVTYADVWEFWLAHPGLADAVDFVTIHVLPYWEDDPVGIEQAVAHVVATYRRAQAALPGREILIGETGWPRAGRARREATPGRVEQAHFVREFVRTARAEGVPYNLIEGFDQPWKRRLEGAMGGFWGLFDSGGAPAFPWRGRVEADPAWRVGLAGSAAGALGFGLLAAASRARGRRLLAQALAGAAVGAVAVAQWRYAAAWHRDG
ncbi:MAG: beta-1,6-glucan synthase, partial [Burkholderiales bacterium]